MNANERELILKDEVFALVSCAMEISNGLGHGLLEKNYENALAVEFSHRQIPFAQQVRFPVSWRNVKVGEFIPDLIAYEQIVVETKTIDRITDLERGQVLNYLRITNLPVAIILNFKKPRLEWERIALTQRSQPPTLH
ncbi:MAG: GxxExxY protein [Akkermansiaceae bacterium]|jgi:GxxExxY protein|nr:GxxExxY protein [Akkermansiaceae bacterium]MDP4646638.1 GxxExxY protein [Akkermansiaceae bacterium]MDP4721046.1 GxxExxY protein [Akkermansiaceae bacterium]MDP4779554.1 GxxExxY protein [Akkermansiaceae bacterium]MDP4846366.1 GxxExxY protein [Akkermansiaceae bacterium]